MKKNVIHSIVIVTISLALAFFAASVTYTAKISGLENSVTNAVIFAQTTPTPRVEEDKSVIGSTDGIVIMGGVIVLIVLVPILLKRKSWMQTD